jgi:hypothetical protein
MCPPPLVIPAFAGEFSGLSSMDYPMAGSWKIFPDPALSTASVNYASQSLHVSEIVSIACPVSFITACSPVASAFRRIICLVNFITSTIACPVSISLLICLLRVHSFRRIFRIVKFLFTKLSLSGELDHRCWPTIWGNLLARWADTSHKSQIIAVRQRLGVSPYKIRFGHEPVGKAQRVSIPPMDGSSQPLSVPVADIQKHCADLTVALSHLHKSIKNLRMSQRAKDRLYKKSGSLPNFAIGDFVLRARVRTTKTHKLSATWIGPYRVIAALSPHLYQVQNLRSGQEHTVHVLRLRYFSNSLLNVTQDMQDTLEHAEREGFFAIRDILDVSSTDDDEVIVLVAWEGFSDDENSWEPLPALFADAPDRVRDCLRRLKLSAAQRRLLQRSNLNL